MRVLFVSGELIAGDLTSRLKLEWIWIQKLPYSKGKKCEESFIIKNGGFRLWM